MRRLLLLACCVAASVAASQPAGPSLIAEARISPDGQSVAFVRQAGVGGRPLGLFRISFAGGAESSIAVPDGLVGQLTWSPSGDALAYVSRSAPGAAGRLRVVPAAGGEPRPLATPGRDVTIFQWSLDGRRLLYESVPEGTPEGPRQINVAAVAGAESTAAFPPLPRRLQAADAVMPVREATIVFVTPVSEKQQSLTLSNGKETWIDLASADGTRITVMPHGIARILAEPSWSADGSRFAVVATPGDAGPEIFGGSLPRAQSNRPDWIGAMPPMVRQLTGTPR